MCAEWRLKSVWSESLLFTDQIAKMCRLTWIFTRCMSEGTFSDVAAQMLSTNSGSMLFINSTNITGLVKEKYLVINSGIMFFFFFFLYFSLTLITLSRQIQQMTNWWYFSYWFQKIGFDISCKLFPKGDNLHEMSNSMFCEKQENIFQNVICQNFYQGC